MAEDFEDLPEDFPVVLTKRLVEDLFNRIAIIESILQEILIQASTLNMMEDIEGALGEEGGE